MNRERAAELLESVLGWLTDSDSILRETVGTGRKILLSEEEAGILQKNADDLVDAICWISEGLTQTAEYHRISITTAEMLAVLEKISDSAANRDYAYLSDIIEYDIFPVFEEWRETLSAAEKSYTISSESE